MTSVATRTRWLAVLAVAGSVGVSPAAGGAPPCDHLGDPKGDAMPPNRRWAAVSKDPDLDIVGGRVDVTATTVRITFRLADLAEPALHTTHYFQAAFIIGDRVFVTQSGQHAVGAVNDAHGQLHRTDARFRRVNEMFVGRGREYHSVEDYERDRAAVLASTFEPTSNTVTVDIPRQRLEHHIRRSLRRQSFRQIILTTLSGDGVPAVRPFVHEDDHMAAAAPHDHAPQLAGEPHRIYPLSYRVGAHNRCWLQ